MDTDIICPHCKKMFLLKVGGDNGVLLENLVDACQELVVVIDDKNYDTDSFTTQPIRMLLKALNQGVKS